MYLDVHDMYIETENKSLKDPKPFNMQIYQAFSPVISLIDTNNWTVISYIHNLIYFPYTFCSYLKLAVLLPVGQ